MTQTDVSANIKDKLMALRDNKDNPEAAAQDLADCLAQQMHDYILSLQISYSSGLIAPSGGGPVTGNFINTLTLV